MNEPSLNGPADPFIYCVRMADPDLPFVDDNGADPDGLSLMGLVKGWV